MLTENEKTVTAYHEGGHALVAAFLPGHDPLHKVTIIPRGRALGVTMQLPSEDKYTYSKTYVENQLAILMGGRVAEELTQVDITTGAGNDIERATAMARRMVCEWGMSELGPLAYGDGDEPIFLGREFAQRANYSDETARKIDEEVHRLVREGHKRAEGILTRHGRCSPASRRSCADQSFGLAFLGEEQPPDAEFARQKAELMKGMSERKKAAMVEAFLEDRRKEYKVEIQPEALK